MTLDEAIKHAEEVAKDNEQRFRNHYYGIGTKSEYMCQECAAEHRQLAEWLKELKAYKEQEPCEDCISRQAVLEQTYNWSKDEFLRVTNPFDYLRKRINALPSVTPQPKIGQWIIIDDCEQFIAKCSECGRIEDSRMISKYPYCHCGAKMDESQEREGGMTNAEIFKRVFGMYATEMWSMPEDDFLNWINLDFGKRQWEWIEHKEV